MLSLQKDQPASPLPTVRGWDDTHASFITAEHGDDWEANRLYFPFLFGEIDDPGALASAQQSLQESAAQATWRLYNSGNELNPAYILRLLDHDSLAWTSRHTENPFLFLAAYIPDVVIGLHTLLRDLALLNRIDDRFPQFAAPEYSTTARSALDLLGDLPRTCNWYSWRPVSDSWQKDLTSSQLQQRAAAFQAPLQRAWNRWDVLRERLGQVEKDTSLHFLRKLSRNINVALEFLRDWHQDCEEAVTRMAQEEAKSIIPEPGIVKTPSMSSGTEPFVINMDNLRGRAGQRSGSSPRKLHKSPPQPADGRRGPGEKKPEVPPQLWRVISSSLVAWLVVAAVPPTVIATVLCETPETMPTHDSNFCSTLGQTMMGLAGLYAIAKPTVMEILEGRRFFGRWVQPSKGVETRWPRTFNALLILTFVMLLAASAVYPYNPQSSIPIGAAASIFANVATLLIIEDSGVQIVHQGETIGKLETELSAYRIR